jgi:N-acetylmuramic acid 6-phosphate etherase
VSGRIAGGYEALLRSVEGAEDRFDEGAKTVADVTELDLVFGIAAGGTTPFVHGALQAARERGAATCFLACVPREVVEDGADCSIRLATGPEVLAGSTRLKAATATKLVLNRITTTAFAHLGKVYDNLMVDVATTGNRKLEERGRLLVARITGLAEDAAGKVLERAGGQVKLACVMQRHDLGPKAAAARLAAAGGFLREALAQSTPTTR